MPCGILKRRKAKPTRVNEAGSYLVGCTYFATLLRQSPVGLPTAPYGKIDPALAETIQKTVWQIVTAHPVAGVLGQLASPMKP